MRPLLLWSNKSRRSVGTFQGLDTFGVNTRSLASISTAPERSRMPVPDVARRKIGVIAQGSVPVDTKAVAADTPTSTAAKTPVTASASVSTNDPQIGRPVTDTPGAAFAPGSAVATLATVSAVTRNKFAVYRQRVSLQIFDLRGRLVRTLEERTFAPGRYEKFWNGCNESGSPVASGAYFVRMLAGDRSEYSKIILLK